MLALSKATIQNRNGTLLVDPSDAPIAKVLMVSALVRCAAPKMKTGWDHVVPLSRQALAILRSVQKLTGQRGVIVNCAPDFDLRRTSE